MHVIKYAHGTRLGTPGIAIIMHYYSTHCNNDQIWSWCTEYWSTVVNRYPAIYVIPCVKEKNGKIKIISSFSVIKLCFVINLLNNKTIIPLNLAKYPKISASSDYGLVG